MAPLLSPGKHTSDHLNKGTHRFTTLAVFGGLQRGLLFRQLGVQGGNIILGPGECFLLPLQLVFEALSLSKRGVDVSIHLTIHECEARILLHSQIFL